MTQEHVPFRVESGEPTKIYVTAGDGKKYILRVTVGVLGAEEDPEKEGPAGMPFFEIKAGLVVDTVEQA